MNWFNLYYKYALKTFLIIKVSFELYIIDCQYILKELIALICESAASFDFWNGLIYKCPKINGFIQNTKINCVFFAGILMKPFIE